MSQAFRRFALRIDTRIQNALNERNRTLWNHPAGPKTIHFWCPMMKVSVNFDLSMLIHHIKI